MPTAGKIEVGKMGAKVSKHDPRTLMYSTLKDAMDSTGYPYRAPAPFFDSRPAAFRGNKWPILGNDRYGCCTFSGIVRIGMARAVAQGKTLPITDKDVIDAYLNYTGGVDSGGSPLEVLNYMRVHGINGYKVLAFARVNSLREGRSALQTFGSLYVAASLPLRLDEDRDRRLELTPKAQRNEKDVPRSMGGHAYDIFGGQRGEEFAVMWRDDLVEEEDWSLYYREEAWVFIDNTIVDEKLLTLMHDQLAAIKAV